MPKLKAKCQTKSDLYISEYPEIQRMIDLQRDTFWPPKEPDVEKDVQQIRVEMTEAERHGVITQLKTFTLRELIVGNEYWGGRYKRMFPRKDFEEAGSLFSAFEVAIHAVFYNRINQVLGLDTPEFHASYKEHPDMVKSMAVLDEACVDKSDLYSIGAFSMVEGAILYSSFAFLMHFQLNGKNFIPNIVSGIRFSARDEKIHADTGALSYNILKKESLEEGVFDKNYVEDIEAKLIALAETILIHEKAMIAMTFQKGPIDGITPKQLENFVKHRLDMCLKNLGIKPIYNVTYNPLAKPFYEAVGADAKVDVFNTISASYTHSWKENNFIYDAAA